MSLFNDVAKIAAQDVEAVKQLNRIADALEKLTPIMQSIADTLKKATTDDGPTGIVITPGIPQPNP